MIEGLTSDNFNRLQMVVTVVMVMEVIVVLVVIMMVMVDVMVHGGGCGGLGVVTMASNRSLTFLADVSVDSWWAEAEVW